MSDEIQWFWSLERAWAAIPAAPPVNDWPDFPTLPTDLTRD